MKIGKIEVYYIFFLMFYGTSVLYEGAEGGMEHLDIFSRREDDLQVEGIKEWRYPLVFLYMQSCFIFI